MFQSFYSTVAQASFTLLGLWWVVLQIRYGPWMRDRRVRRAVYDISLYFLLPGMMSLMALLAADVSTIWRVSFATAGVVGTLEAILSIAGNRGHDSPSQIVDLGNWLSLVLYPAVAAIAIRRTIPHGIGIDLRPLEAEGILIGLLLALGVLLGAALFVKVDAVNE
ncbi:MAG: hypothetical protein ACXVRK_16350 [Gaiellaceae bacterium]